MNYYFDLETIGLNPFKTGAKVLTAQFLDDDDNLIILTEWELGEHELLDQIQNIFLEINHSEDLKQRSYNPVFTYNGKFDFHFYMNRCAYYQERKSMGIIFDTVILSTKHCDLMQFDNGFFKGLDTIAKKHKIKRTTKFLGKHIEGLYYDEKYDDIIAHATDDVVILKKLVELGYGKRFI